ncbi:MAG TPA: ABC transporter permease subunit [Thermomicrobiales bacterium]|nr:ABC transporter permease subunit [Thermomicrobiales bacterium]
MTSQQVALPGAAMSRANIASGEAKSAKIRKFWRLFRRNQLGVVGAVIVLIFVLIAIFGKWLTPYDPIAQHLPSMLQGPSSQHWFGTDDFGRDIFSRVIAGTRVSLLVGVVATGTGALIGSIAGLIAGYYDRLDTWIMRVMDILLAFPSILLAIGVIAVLGPSLTNVMIAVGIRSIPTYARLVRSTVLSVKNHEYIEAARTIGCRDGAILFKHIFPNCVNTLIVVSSLQIGDAILTASLLSFLGLGVQPPTPEWGQMVNAGRGLLREAPHIATFPGLALFLVVMGFNLLGDGLRDALDPRMKNT